MQIQTLDKEKYLQIAKREGLPAAITALHREMEEIEQECMEGLGGFDSAVYDELKKWRAFSTELWDKRYDPEFSDSVAQ